MPSTTMKGTEVSNSPVALYEIQAVHAGIIQEHGPAYLHIEAFPKAEVSRSYYTILLLYSGVSYGATDSG